MLPLPSGEPVEVWTEIFPTGAVVVAGYKLRLTLQAFDTPHPSQLILPVRGQQLSSR